METLRESVVNAIESDSVSALMQLVDSHGATAVKLEDDTDGLTALHAAAAIGSTECAKWLLSPAIGADPSAQRINSFTPLHSAAMYGRSEVCTLLLEAGADPNIQTDPQLYAPLHSAAYGGHSEVIRILLSAGADPNLKNHRGETPGQTALRQNQYAAATLLGCQPPSLWTRLKKLLWTK